MAAVTVTVEKKKLQKLLNYFYEVCSLCDEMDVYEFEEGDASMQKMKTWVQSNFGREIK
jgi:hypothetical protein